MAMVQEELQQKVKISIIKTVNDFPEIDETDVIIDVHLMVKPVDRIIPDFAKAGANIITFHPEGSDHIDRSLSLVRESGCKSGLVFNPAGALITGDTLFVTRCGRADFPGSDPEAMYRSLMRLAAFPPETKVFPGHDYGPKPQSTIGFEREHNEYMKCPDLESFIKLRMG